MSSSVGTISPTSLESHKSHVPVTTNQIILYHVISIIIIHHEPLLTIINHYYILLTVGKTINK